MSKYTTEVRFICEQMADLDESVGYKQTNEVITLAMPKVFDFDFPIFDEEYRPVLERKILRHFYTREICEETVGLWQLRLEDKLNIIMPYYNQLYKSQLLEFNPFYDVELSTSRIGHQNETIKDDNKHSDVSSIERNNESETNRNVKADGTDVKINKGNEKGKGNDSNDSWDLYSDTPQGGITGIKNAYGESAENDDPSLASKAYLTNARNVRNSGSNQYERGTEDESINKSNTQEESKDNLKITETNKGVNNSTDNRNRTAQNLENYLEKVHGKRGAQSFSALLKEYRSTFLNIDAMILEELEELFMQVW